MTKIFYTKHPRTAMIVTKCAHNPVIKVGSAKCGVCKNCVKRSFKQQFVLCDKKESK